MESQDCRTLDAKRRKLFKALDDSCLAYMRDTKDRPSWRLAWICAGIMTALSTLVYAACANASAMNLTTFCMLVWFVSFGSAYSVLSYFVWHVICPHYSCARCIDDDQNSDE